MNNWFHVLQTVYVSGAGACKTTMLMCFVTTAGVPERTRHHNRPHASYEELLNETAVSALAVVSDAKCEVEMMEKLSMEISFLESVSQTLHYLVQRI